MSGLIAGSAATSSPISTRWTTRIQTAWGITVHDAPLLSNTGALPWQEVLGQEIGLLGRDEQAAVAAARLVRRGRPMDRPRAPRGSLTPLITPFRDGVIDEPAFRGLVEHQVDGGSHGVTVAGTTGEPAALSLRERERLVELALDAARGRLPVLAGTGTNELSATLRLTRAAQRLGAAVLVVTPYYVKPSQRGLVESFRAVADATDLPVILYDIPGRAGVALDAPTITAIADTAPNVVGVKKARADLDHVSRVLADCGTDFAVYCALVTTDELDLDAITFTARVNGELRQSGDTGRLVHRFVEIVASYSRALPLAPGDVILTGTPCGVGVARGPAAFLDGGDVVVVSSPQLGTLRTPVVRGLDSG